MFLKIGLLSASAAMGVMVATAGTCGVGLVMGTGAWCALPLYWIVGFPIAIIPAILFGYPMHSLFNYCGLRQWWHFAFGGLIMALPFWSALALPLESPRWAIAGFYDTLNYLGTGAVAGFTFWWLAIRPGAEYAP
jgi:hypothetical protein